MKEVAKPEVAVTVIKEGKVILLKSLLAQYYL